MWERANSNYVRKGREKKNPISGNLENKALEVSSRSGNVGSGMCPSQSWFKYWSTSCVSDGTVMLGWGCCWGGNAAGMGCCWVGGADDVGVLLRRGCCWSGDTLGRGYFWGESGVHLRLWNDSQDHRVLRGVRGPDWPVKRRFESKHWSVLCYTELLWKLLCIDSGTKSNHLLKISEHTWDSRERRPCGPGQSLQSIHLFICNCFNSWEIFQKVSLTSFPLQKLANSI